MNSIEGINFQEQSKLSRITLITSYGDYFSEFSLIILLYKAINDGLFAGLAGVGIGSVAAVLAGVLIPVGIVRIGSKQVILISQIGSALVISLLLRRVVLGIPIPAWISVGVLFIITFSNEWFKAARESHSHSFVANVTEHRGAQIQLLTGFYQAQFLGPLSAFIFLRYFSVSAAMSVDIATFVFAAILASQLNNSVPTESSPRPILQPFHNVIANQSIRRIFCLRTLGFWVPSAIFNVLIFQSSLVPKSGGIEFSALWYSIMGLGGFLGSLLVKRSSSFQRLSNAQISSFANLGFASVCILMIGVSSIANFGLCYALYGMCMGINAIGSQAWRRSVVSSVQLPELMGLEIVTGLSLQIVIASAFTSIGHSFSRPAVAGYYFAATGYFLAAIFARKWDPIKYKVPK